MARLPFDDNSQSSAEEDPVLVDSDGEVQTRAPIPDAVDSAGPPDRGAQPMANLEQDPPSSPNMEDRQIILRKPPRIQTIWSWSILGALFIVAEVGASIAIKKIKSMIGIAPSKAIPLGCSVALLINLLIMTLGGEHANSTMPVCKVPIISKHISRCARDPPIPPILPVLPDFSQLMSLQSKLEHVMDESARGAMAAVDIKNSEMAMRDLTTLVKLSSLPSKDPLANRLDGFVTDAKATGRSLQKFGSRVGGTVDQIVAMNEQVLLLLEDAQPVGGKTLIVSESSQKDVTAAWRRSIDLLKSTIQKLIHEAEHNIVALERLKEKLNVIHDIIVRDDDKIQNRADELSQLWTWLGANKKELRYFEKNRQLLNDLRHYRDGALRHIKSALHKLQQMSDDLDILQERVAAPSLEGEESSISIGHHIRNIQKGTEQLVARQILAREQEDAYRKRMFSGEDGYIAQGP